tara:strand:- start:854 stop:1066 length:213 start_codon:yes stop_codon:yes gene_type:complete
MSSLTHLTIAYLGMIGAIAIWTWTVFSRSKRLEQKIATLENILEVDSSSGNKTEVEQIENHLVGDNADND